MGLIHALKEWNVAVAALEQGETIMLLRKGGIRDEGKTFTVAHDQVLLYPTYEHQQPQLLKAPYDSQVEPVESGWHPTAVRISSWARITDVLQITDAAIVNAILPFHIWNQEFVSNRLRWKPNQPLYVLLLRVYTLPQPHMLSYEPMYGGCKSWIDLAEKISLVDSSPVLSNDEYANRVAIIHKTITAL